MDLPLSLDDISPEWLSFALSEKFPGVKVQSIKQSSVIHGSATKAKLDVAYAPGTTETPPSTMWLKIGFEPHSQLIKEVGFYDAEAHFYKKYLPQLEVSAPVCYFEQSQISPPQTAILLEDLGTRQAVCTVATKPLSIEQTAAGLRTLAKLHAKTWNSPIIDEMGVKPAVLEGETMWLDDFMNNAPAYLNALRGYSIPMSLHKPDRLRLVWERYKQFVTTGPRVLLHGDSHAGNSFVEPNGTVAFLDWQLVCYGHWVHDIGYFIVSALDIPDRRRADRDLLKSYLADLARFGVANPPSFEEAWEDYRKNLTFALAVWLGNPDAMQKPEINLVCLARAGAAFEENDGFEAFGA